MRTLERAGASAIQLEDQHAPKRCGHFAGKELIPAVEMVGKVRAAADARREGMVIIARTDACAVEGFQAAIDRARRYIEAGADMTFVEAPENLDDLQAVPKRLAAPQLLNMVLGGKTPIIDAAEATRIGFAFVLYANAALQGAILGMENALKVLRDLRVSCDRRAPRDRRRLENEIDAAIEAPRTHHPLAQAGSHILRPRVRASVSRFTPAW